MIERTLQLRLALAALCGACGGETAAPRTQVVTLAPPPSTTPPPTPTTGATADVPDAALPDPEPAEQESPAGFGISGTTMYTGTGLGRGTGLGLSPDGGARHYPTITASTGTVSVGLPLEIVRRIVRRNFGRIRYCYELGLQKDPKLQGRVTVKFGIDPTGKVTKASKSPGTTLPDADVVRCVVRSFDSMLFPRPQGGAVVVDYPIDFAP